MTVAKDVQVISEKGLNIISQVTPCNMYCTLMNPSTPPRSLIYSSQKKEGFVPHPRVALRGVLNMPHSKELNHPWACQAFAVLVPTLTMCGLRLHNLKLAQPSIAHMDAHACAHLTRVRSLILS